MKKKIFFSIIIIFALTLIVGVLKVELVKASLLPAGSWLWGGSDQTINGVKYPSGVGWIEMQGVGIPSIDGPVKGFGYIPTLNTLIDFNPQDHCISSGTPTGDQYLANCSLSSGTGNGGVFRSADKLTGWARIVGIAKEHMKDNSGGNDEDGWVQFGAGNGYDVTIGSDKISGYAWAGKTLGAISFERVAFTPVTVTLSAPPFVYLDRTETFASNKKYITLSWAIGGNPSNCSRTCKLGNGTNASCDGWSNNTSTSATGEVNNILVSGELVDFTLTCDGISKTRTVQYGCYNNVCDNGTCSSDVANSTPQIYGSRCGGCQTNEDCVVGGSASWREVSPTL